MRKEVLLRREEEGQHERDWVDSCQARQALNVTAPISGVTHNNVTHIQDGYHAESKLVGSVIQSIDE